MGLYWKTGKLIKNCLCVLPTLSIDIRIGFLSGKKKKGRKVCIRSLLIQSKLLLGYSHSIFNDKYIYRIICMTVRLLHR